MQRSLRFAQLPAQLGESRSIVVVAVYVVQQTAHLFERRLLESTMLFQAVLGATLQLIQRPAGLGYSDNRKVESFVADEVLQRGKDLFVGQITGGPKEDESIRHSVRHCCPH